MQTQNIITIFRIIDKQNHGVSEKNCRRSVDPAARSIGGFRATLDNVPETDGRRVYCMIAEYFRRTIAQLESVAKSVRRRDTRQRFRSRNNSVRSISVSTKLRSATCIISNAPAPEWKQEQFDSLEIQRAESHSLQNVRREYLTSPYTFKSRRRGHTPIKLRTFAKGGDRKSIGSDFSNGVYIVFVSRGTMLVPSGYRTMPFASSLTQRTARAKLRA